MAELNSKLMQLLKDKRIAYHTLGCKVNAYETEAMQQMLEAYGMVTVAFDCEEGADVYLINTCSVTNIADRKSRQMLRKARAMSPGCIVIGAGCYVQIAGETLLEQGLCDILIGTNQKNELPYLLGRLMDESWQQEEEVEELLPMDISRPTAYEDQQISRVENHARAFMKIQEGCNQFCTYCIIPYARGRIRSRSEESILQEACALAKSGVQEIVLTGIHLDSYGLDLEEHTSKLSRVVRLLGEIEGIERIRLGSLEPRIITEEFLEEVRGVKEFCPHFHLSLQSGSDSVLKRMNRHYTTAEYARSCDLIRAYFAHPLITTDVITGFPMETEEEAEETYEFLERIRFYELNVFPYSRRKGTKADLMEGQLTEAVKKQRGARLIALDRQISAAYRKEWMQEGYQETLLVEECIEHEGVTYLTGHTKNYFRCVIARDEYTDETVPRNGDIIEIIPLEELPIGKEIFVLAKPF